MADQEETLRYCSGCGAPLRNRRMPADSVLRRVCEQCGQVAYRNPGILVTTIVETGGKVLMCRRAQPPRVGFWTLPGGFMECDESLEEAAVRETREETGIDLNVGELRFYGISSVVDISQVYVGFLTQLTHELPAVCGVECQEAMYFSEEDMPWQDLAFPDMERYLRSFFSEYRRGEQHIHFGHLSAEKGLRDDFQISGSTRSFLSRGSGGEDPAR